MHTFRRLASLLFFLAPMNASAQGPAVLRGRVLVDSTELPLVGATVVLPGQALTATTDSTGRFRLAGIAPGIHDIIVRQIGFTAFTGRLGFRSNDSLVVEFVLAPAVQLLSGVNVATTLTSRKLVEFNERRRLGVGHFLDSTDIAKGPGTRMSEKLRHLPGLSIYCRSTECTLSSTRGQSSLSQRCTVGVGIDGALVGGFNINWLQPSEVAAVEWYAGPAQMPARFNTTRNACGFLMIWTR